MNHTRNLREVLFGQRSTGANKMDSAEGQDALSFFFAGRVLRPVFRWSTLRQTPQRSRHISLLLSLSL